MLRITYNALGFKLKGTLQVCDGCERLKVKESAVRNKTYRRTSNSEEIIFVDTAGLLPENLIVNWYWIGVLDNYSHYYWILFTNTKSQLTNKMEKLF